MKQKQRDLFNQEKYPPRDKKELAEKFPNLGQSWKPTEHPQKTGDPWLTTLTTKEMAWGEWIAKAIIKNGKEWGAQTTFGASEEEDTPEARLFSQIQGHRAEIAVAKILNLEYPKDFLDRIGKPDFGPRDGTGLCVRSTSVKFYPKIPVRPHDPDHCVFIMVSVFTPETFRMHAWCWGDDAKAKTPLTNPQPYGKLKIDKPVHHVQMCFENEPNPIVNIFGGRGHALPETVLALCPKGYRVWDF